MHLVDNIAPNYNHNALNCTGHTLGFHRIELVLLIIILLHLKNAFTELNCINFQYNCVRSCPFLMLDLIYLHHLC